MKKYRPKSFIKWLDTVDKDTWWELFEPSLINSSKKDLLKEEYEKYVKGYIRNKKLKDLGL